MVSRRLNRVLLLLALFSLAAGCKRQPLPAPAAASTAPADQFAQAFAGADSPEELQQEFLTRFSSGNVDSLMALFYLQGASPQMIELYRNGLPKREAVTISSSQIAAMSADRKANSVHTLKPEMCLVLEFGKSPRQGDLTAVEQYFFIGLHNGKYFLTLPTGD